MSAVDSLREQLPMAAKDIRLNLGNVLGESSLSPSQTWGVALACALATRNSEVSKTIYADAKTVVSEAVIEDAVAAASLMGMNNILYRFRHMVGKPDYEKRPARLRMQRLAQPATSKLDFELFCLAVSTINGCEACVRAHEAVATSGGLSEEQVYDAVRIAAVVHAAAVARDTASILSGHSPVP